MLKNKTIVTITQMILATRDSIQPTLIFLEHQNTLPKHHRMDDVAEVSDNDMEDTIRKMRKELHEVNEAMVDFELEFNTH